MSTSITVYPRNGTKPVAGVLADRASEILREKLGVDGILISVADDRKDYVFSPANHELAPVFLAFDQKSNCLLTDIYLSSDYFEADVPYPLTEHDSEIFDHDVWDNYLYFQEDFHLNGMLPREYEATSHLPYDFHFEGVWARYELFWFALVIAVAEVCDGLVVSHDCGLPARLNALPGSVFSERLSA